MLFAKLKEQLDAYIIGFCAVTTGTAGFATALAMIFLTGDFAEELPTPIPFAMSAFAGAALAGVFASVVLGRAGIPGWVLAILAWPVITILGAGLATMPFLLFDMPYSWDWMENAFFLGPFAVAISIFRSPVVGFFWVVSGMGVHFAMVRVRSAVNARRERIKAGRKNVF